MRNLLLITWLMLPIGAWAYHEGPGQDRQKLEQMDATIVAAHADAAAGRWHQAVRGYEQALKERPSNPDALDATVTQRLQLELAKARMQSSGLPDAREELEALVEHLGGERDADPALLRDARQALARAQFFTTWLMRLEGLPREEWEPEIEAARQNWRWLAERGGDATEVAAHQRDLEAAIRLERIEIEDLQGLPLPGE